MTVSTTTENITNEIITNPIIKDVAAGRIEPFANDTAIAANPELAKQLQGRLKQFYLLRDVDGDWGKKSAKALANFKTFRGISEEGLGKITAAALINTDPKYLINGYQLNGDWASRTLMWYQLNNYRISNNPDECNILYFRGLNRDGTLNPNRPFVFNDRRIIMMFRKENNCFIPYFAGNWLATSEPGKYYWENPLNDLGCACVLHNAQYKAWVTGCHNKTQKALVQAAEITVLRGPNRTPDKGDFAINHHSVAKTQNFSPGDEIGQWSAGCGVQASREEHDNEFMPLVYSDPREQAAPGKYLHWVAYIDGKDFLDAFPDPRG